MKTLIQITTVLLLLVQTIGFSQTKNPETNSKKQDTIINKKSTKTAIDTEKFIGIYYLAEADFNLEIIQESNKMYIISPFSKDLLIPINKTTLREVTRGVNLELIKTNENALKYTQNGYETVIKKVNSKTEN